MLFVGLLAALGEPLESSIELTGAGATFPQPFYEYAFNRYPTAEPSLVVRYQGVGSGAGAVSLLKREVDFAASDVVFSDEERKRAAADLVEVPTCLGAVTVVVNLPGNPRIRLTSEILAAMFLGRITHWMIGTSSTSIRARPCKRCLSPYPCTVHVGLHGTRDTRPPHLAPDFDQPHDRSAWVHYKMGDYPAEDLALDNDSVIPYYSWLAKTYTFCDHHFGAGANPCRPHRGLDLCASRCQHSSAMAARRFRHLLTAS